MLAHDFSVGPRHACQVCGSSRLELVVDLGHQPLCDSLLTEGQLSEPEVTYPLRFQRCLDCSLGQLDFVAPPEVVFYPRYPYRSGITRELAAYQRAMAESLIQEHQLPAGSLVVDIGSNDGTLLAAFRRHGMRVVGVEPTNIARFAMEAGCETVQAFFDEAVATSIVEKHGQAAMVTSTNTFAHVAQLGGYLRGVAHLLDRDGVFVSESHNLLDIVEKGQFDTIYHEHLRSYSLRSLVRLHEMYDLTVVHAERVSRYGGNIRVHAVRGQQRAPATSVTQLLAEEAAFGLYDAPVYDAFRRRAERTKLELLEFALKAKTQGKLLVGKSCPGRCATLLNYAGITRDLMPYIGEQSTSLKLGLYLPGKHIPVVDDRAFERDQPDYIVLLAWHYTEPIAAELRGRGLRSTLVVPLPDLRLLGGAA